MVNRDSATRWARRLDVQSEVGVLFFNHEKFVAESTIRVVKNNSGPTNCGAWEASPAPASKTLASLVHWLPCKVHYPRIRHLIAIVDKGNVTIVSV